MNRRIHKNWLALIVFLVVPLSGLGIDIVSPSLPAIAHYFSASKALSQLNITTYMIGFALALLISGSIADSVGRKKPFIIFIVLYILASLCIVLSDNIHELLILRCVQGA